MKYVNLLFELHVETTTSGRNCENFAKTLHQNTYIQSILKMFIQSYRDDQPWMIFKLARMCARYSYFDVAFDLYSTLSGSLSRTMLSERDSKDLSYKTWLDFMNILCKAESLIQQSQAKNLNEFIGELNDALSLYLKGLSLFKSMCIKYVHYASSSLCNTIADNSNSYFQTRYCELRSEQIKLYIHIVLSSLTYQTIPAPKYQFNSSDNLEKYGRIAQQFKYSTIELQKLVQKYKEFISECFDADTHSLNILNM